MILKVASIDFCSGQNYYSMRNCNTWQVSRTLRLQTRSHPTNLSRSPGLPEQLQPLSM